MIEMISLYKWVLTLCHTGIHASQQQEKNQDLKLHGWILCISCKKRQGNVL